MTSPRWRALLSASDILCCHHTVGPDAKCTSVFAVGSPKVSAIAFPELAFFEADLGLCVVSAVSVNGLTRATAYGEVGSHPNVDNDPSAHMVCIGLDATKMSNICWGRVNPDDPVSAATTIVGGYSASSRLGYCLGLDRNVRKSDRECNVCGRPVLFGEDNFVADVDIHAECRWIFGELCIAVMNQDANAAEAALKKLLKYDPSGLRPFALAVNESWEPVCGNCIVFPSDNTDKIKVTDKMLVVVELEE